MKINEHEIAQAAKRLRDDENAKLRVRQWNRRRMAVPSWLVYIPAAAIVGFVFGLWLGNKQPSTNSHAVAKVDTVYVKQLERVVEYDTIYSSQTSTPGKSKSKQIIKTGVPMTKDNVPYHLLVMQ